MRVHRVQVVRGDRLVAAQVAQHLLVVGGAAVEALGEIGREARGALCEPSLVVGARAREARLPGPPDRAEALWLGPAAPAPDRVARVLEVRQRRTCDTKSVLRITNADAVRVVVALAFLLADVAAAVGASEVDRQRDQRLRPGRRRRRNREPR